MIKAEDNFNGLFSYLPKGLLKLSQPISLPPTQAFLLAFETGGLSKFFVCWKQTKSCTNDISLWPLVIWSHIKHLSLLVRSVKHQ